MAISAPTPWLGDVDLDELPGIYGDVIGISWGFHGDIDGMGLKLVD